MFEQTGGEKVSIDHDCESDTIVKEEVITCADIRFHNCKRLLYILIPIGLIVLVIEFSHYQKSKQIAVKKIIP